MDNPSLLIFGSGAMACFFAARLASSAQPVCLVDDWVAGIQAIRKNGIQVNHQPDPVFVQTCLPGEPLPECRLAIVLVKSWQTARVAQQLKKCLFTNGLALTLQNGLGNDILLAQELGSQRVAVGITTLGATLVSPGKVNTFDQGEITLQAGPNIHEIKSILDSAAFTTNMDASIDCIIWGKLVVNSAINPLTALLEIPNGMLLELPSAMDLMEQITREAVQTAAQINITLPYANPMQQVKTVISATASNYSSMYQDILRGAPTEIDQINGAILNLAQENGLKLPYNQSITALIKAKVIKNSLRIQ